jgi:hypothetical protein
MISIPDRMRHLERDHRGYPIPFIVLRDTTGRAHFSVNNDGKRLLCFARDLCGICGTKLYRGRWFVGGPLSALDPHGVYVDPPMHAECARFSLQVCPYLCSDHYSRSIAGRSFSEAERAKMATQVIDYTMLPERPALFLAIMSIDQKLSGQGLQTYVRPARPYRSIEYWRHGKQLRDVEGRRALALALAEHAQKQRAGST